MRLVRFAYLPDATLGRLELGSGPVLSWWTVERPWRDNEPNESCIPLGSYPMRPRWFHRGGYQTWEIAEVPDRSLILIHRANRAHQVEGCIAVGLDCRDGAVWRSRDALDELLRAFPPTGPGPWLEVVEDLGRFGRAGSRG